MNIRNIAVHNTGGTQSDPGASSQSMTQKQVNDYHKSKWDFKSDLGRYGGYNFFIEKDGSVTQFRKVGEETAAQYGHNFDTVSICLAGNFSVMSMDIPTRAQELALVNIMEWLFQYGKGIQNKVYSVKDGTTFDLDVSRIYPHRLLQVGTECHGLKLKDTWARDLYMKELGIPALMRIIAGLRQQLSLLLNEKKRKVLGSEDRGCDAIIG